MIDAHQHFWHYDPGAHTWITDEMKVIRRDFLPADLQPLLQAHGVEGSVVVQVDQTEDETHQLLKMAADHDFIRGVVGWIDLRSADLAGRLDYFSGQKKLKGFRHIVQAEATGFLSQPSFIKGVQLLGRHHFTYDLLVYHHQLAEALQFVRQVPDTQIVIDHLAKPSIVSGSLREWEVHMRAMAEHQNVYCKVSGMVTEAKWSGWTFQDFVPYLDVVTEAFGSDRLMYGSDWPVCLVAASYTDQRSIVEQYFETFSPPEKNCILGGNAERFYNL